MRPSWQLRWDGLSAALTPLSSFPGLVAGIYVIGRGSTALYVGQSERVQLRVKEHHVGRGRLRNVWVGVFPMPESTVRDRESIEAALIRALCPSLNKQRRSFSKDAWDWVRSWLIGLPPYADLFPTWAELTRRAEEYHRAGAA